MNLFDKSIEKDQKKQMSILKKIAFSLFGGSNKNLLEINPEKAYSENSFKGTFDLLICDLGLGVRLNNSFVSKEDKYFFKSHNNWKKLLDLSGLLSEKGFALVIMEPEFWSYHTGKLFQKILSENNFHINAVFQMPTKFLQSVSIRPHIVLFSRTEEKEIYFVELEEKSDLKKIAKNFKRKISSDNLYEGIFLNSDSFKSFERYKSENEFKLLSKQYKQYKKVCIKDFVKEVKKNNFEKDEESIYLRTAGSFRAVDFSEITKNNYLQLKLDTKIVSPLYLQTFFNSEIGLKFLDSFSKGVVVKFLEVHEFLQSSLYLLPLELQTKTFEILKDVNTLDIAINGFKDRILLDPNSSYSIMNKLNKVKVALETLSEEEEYLSIIRSGENQHVEFKQTLSKNIKTEQADKTIEKMVLKTICGFLNTSGGTLFVGVDDSGDIYGIDKDIHPNNDKYLLHFRNLLKDQIGDEFFTLVDYEIKKLLNKDVLVVKCIRSKKPVFLGQEEIFYIRSNPATDELKGRELLEYIKNHFKN